jgi:hypothetical protein
MANREKIETFEKRLKVYSAAAAGVLALAPAAEAAIVHSGPQNLPVSSSQSQSIDLNNDGTDDFIFGYFGLSSYPFPYYVYLMSAAGGQGHIAGDAHSDPVRLPNNYPIGSNLPNPSYYWNNGQNTLNGSVFGSTDTMGSFNNATGYIGVRFNASCGTAYGWIHYQGVTTIGNTATGTIIDWAYDNTCQPIAAGQTRSIVAVPTLNQWGMIVFTLLLGGIAARMLRKRGREES